MTKQLKFEKKTSGRKKENLGKKNSRQRHTIGLTTFFDLSKI